MGQSLGQGVDGDIWPPQGDRASTVTSGTFAAIGPGIARTFFGPFNVEIWASINTSLATTNGSGTATVGSGTGLAVGSSINSVNVPAGTTIKTLSGTTATLAFPTFSLPCQYESGFPAITGLPLTAGLVGASVTGPGWPAGTTVLSIAQAYTAAGPNGAQILGQVVTSAAPTQNSPAPGYPVGGTGSNKILFGLTNNAVTTGTDTAAVFMGSGVTFSATIELERSFDGGATWITCNAGGTGTLAQYSTGTPVSFIAGECEEGVGYRLNCTAYTSGTINYRMSTNGQAALSLAVTATV